jgi:DNA-binding SARP family transcriptional activator
MRYEILGSLRIRDENEWSSISARKIETLLAALLIRADQVVSIEQLIAEIWGANAPRRATAALHVYVCQLRKFLARPGQSVSPIVTRSPGYMLQMGPDTLDFQMFDELVGQGRTHARAGRPDQALATFGTALKLWRGPALAELRNGPIINGFVTWLDEMHLETIEMTISCYLTLGRHREVVGWLQTLIAEHPLHEAFYHLLMMALFRSERRADALKVYRGARDTLMRELGLEPGRTLVQLQQTILLSDPEPLPVMARPA